jgi:hypothetical protein
MRNKDNKTLQKGTHRGKQGTTTQGCLKIE